MDKSKKKKIVCISVLVFSLIAISVAAYLYNLKERQKSPYNSFTTEDFFFSSSLLMDGENEGEVTESSKISNLSLIEWLLQLFFNYNNIDRYIEIPIENYYDDLSISPRDIRYTATVESNCSAAFQKSASVTGTLKGGQKSENVLRVEYKSGTANYIKVTVRSTEPYEKTLTFIYGGDDVYATLITDTTDYNYPIGENAEVLLIEYGNYTKDISVSWKGTDVVIDSTNELISGKKDTDKDGEYDYCVISGSDDKKNSSIALYFLSKSYGVEDDDIILKINSKTTRLKKDIRTNITEFAK